MNPPRKGTPDFLLLFLTFLLVCFGLAMVFSASSMTGAYTEGDPWYFTKKQIIAVVIGTIGMLFCMNIHFTKLKKLVIPAFVLVLGSLVFVLLVAEEANGARSWIRVGPLSLQPTEFAKLGIIMYLAALISNKDEKFRDFKRGLLPALFVVGLVSFLILLQNDFGSTFIVLLTAATVILVGGSNLKHVFLLGAGFVTFAAVGLAIYLLNSTSEANNYRLDRLTTFLDPWSTKLDEGYQIIQSLYAFGHGGLVGAGFGRGIQKLHYLPEAHNDFIFAIIGEELGFIGIVIFLFIYLLFLWRGILIAVRCSDTFGTLTGIGIMGMIGFQAIINIGGVTSTIPLTGVTLPLISAGGSSMMAVLISMGVLLSISREQSLPPLKAAKSVKDTSRSV
jgi:cell division protein FtsW